MIRKNIIMQLALATLIGMPLIAILIDRFSESVDLAASVVGFESWWIQIFIGILVGLLIAFVAQKIIETPLLQKVNSRYANMFGRFQLSFSEILFVSLCAGIGEEMLFRGALQPLIGLVLTAVVFVAIHGYINPKNWQLSLYGLYMTIAMLVIGYMTSKLGLMPAILAHTVIDIYLLQKLQMNAGKIPFDENASLNDDYSEETKEQEF